MAVPRAGGAHLCAGAGGAAGWGAGGFGGWVRAVCAAAVGGGGLTPRPLRGAAQGAACWNLYRHDYLSIAAVVIFNSEIFG